MGSGIRNVAHGETRSATHVEASDGQPIVRARLIHAVALRLKGVGNDYHGLRTLRIVAKKYHHFVIHLKRVANHEFAGAAIHWSAWATTFYERHVNRGKRHHAALRALAYKWIRIYLSLLKKLKFDGAF